MAEPAEPASPEASQLASAVEIAGDRAAQERLDEAMRSMDRGTFSAAARLLDEAERWASASPRIRAALLVGQGRLEWEMGRTERAIAPLTEACRLDPKLHLAPYYLGLARADLDRHRGACEALSRSIALGPGSPEAQDALRELDRLRCPAPHAERP